MAPHPGNDRQHRADERSAALQLCGKLHTSQNRVLVDYRGRTCGVAFRTARGGAGTLLGTPPCEHETEAVV